MGTNSLFQTTLIIQKKNQILNKQKSHTIAKAQLMILTILQQKLKKKPDPKEMNEIINSAILKIKLKVNTHTCKDSLVETTLICKTDMQNFFKRVTVTGYANHRAKLKVKNK